MKFGNLVKRNAENFTRYKLSGYHADTPITIKAEPSIWPTAAFINIHEHPFIRQRAAFPPAVN